MKNQILSKPLLGYRFLLSVALFFFISGCCGLRSGVKKFEKHELNKAKKSFNRAKKQKPCKEGAEFYLIKISTIQDKSIENLIGANQKLHDLEKRVNLLPLPALKKLDKYKASRGEITKYRANLKDHIYEEMAKGATIEQLQALTATKESWNEKRLDSLERIITNKIINPSQQVFDTKLDKKWKTPSFQPLTEAKIYAEKGRSCVGLVEGNFPHIGYDDVTIIAKEYSETILPINYPVFWQIKRNIWSIFERDNSYCDMQQFKIDHPNNWTVDDCWFDAAKDALCLSELQPLLTFHRNNPHTALDYSICMQILCLASNIDLTTLSPAEAIQVDDVQTMLTLHSELLNCGPERNAEKLIDDIAYLIKKYKHHRVVYDIAVEALDYFATAKKYVFAEKALNTFRPLFTDVSVCATSFTFQTGKAEWFEIFTKLLQRGIAENVNPEKSYHWNTNNDEYALISWGETDEVFFVRRDIEANIVKVMTSRLKGEKWTKPKGIKKLSFAKDVIPLSISAKGREMLLQAQGKLWRSYRLKVGRQWSKPEEMPIRGKFPVTGWLSPNDSLLLTEYYALPPTSTSPPKTNIATAKLLENDSYGRMRPVEGNVNLLLSSESEPVMALGGRELFYTSDKKGSLGKKDMYSIVLGKPNDWSTAKKPINLGIPLNTIYKDEGLTYFSEYTGKAYFHRKDKCRGDMDIWQVKLAGGVFPQNAMRLAGLIVNEKGKPIGGGFMEFTPNYQLNVHTEIISNKGTYSYTVADSTEVVRLFPEIPGYYSERDTIHSLTKKLKGSIIRDTFRLLSFDYIRKYFKLAHTTFHKGTSEFNNKNKAYPELTRLAKIATRMGADLILTGHTDNTGLPSGHKKLSKSRVESVRDFLVKKCGFDADRIEIRYFGSSKPICKNDTAEGRRCNRRVEVIFKMPDLVKEKP